MQRDTQVTVTTELDWLDTQTNNDDDYHYPDLTFYFRRTSRFSLELLRGVLLPRALAEKCLLAAGFRLLRRWVFAWCAGTSCCTSLPIMRDVVGGPVETTTGAAMAIPRLFRHSLSRLSTSLVSAVVRAVAARTIRQGSLSQGQRGEEGLGG